VQPLAHLRDAPLPLFNTIKIVYCKTPLHYQSTGKQHEVGTHVGLLTVVHKVKDVSEKDSQLRTRRKTRQISKATHEKKKIIFKASEKQKPSKGKERGKKINTSNPFCSQSAGKIKNSNFIISKEFLSD